MAPPLLNRVSEVSIMSKFINMNITLLIKNLTLFVKQITPLKLSRLWRTSFTKEDSFRGKNQ